MTREIDQEALANQSLSWEDAKYLQDRMKLPAGYPMPDPPEQDDDEDFSPPSPKSRVTPLEDQSELVMGRNGGIVDDDEDSEEDYVGGWNNDQRRAALSERGLSVNGNKDELIARLRRADAEELLDEDYSEV